MKITDKQIEKANFVNLPSFLMRYGFELKKAGTEYIWKVHDSVNIKDNSPSERGKWYRFSTQEGGDNIAFVQKFMDKSFIEAVGLLNDEIYDRNFSPEKSDKSEPKKVRKSDIFIAENADCKRVFAYLCKTRRLDYDMISELVKSGKIAQEQKTGNVIFKVADENNRLVGAEKAGTSTLKKFKGTAAGSAGGYGFEVCRGNGGNLLFFESSIDLLSYFQMKNPGNCRLVSMMGVKPNIVIETMERHGIPPENVFICSDNDKAGNEFFQRLQTEFPQINRTKPDENFKDWNDMLRKIPMQKETEKMVVYGNKIWNDATDNRDKTLVSMPENEFEKMRNMLNNSGINYFAYSKNDTVVMAVNDKDLKWLKQISGNENLFTKKSDVSYIPPQKNIIGNTEYRCIPDKNFISCDRDTALKTAEIMAKNNIQFSGRIYPSGKAALTVSGADFADVQAIQQNVINMRKQFAKAGTADEIIGNKAYRDIQNKHFYYSKLSPEQYQKIKPFIDTNVHYSGLIRSGKVTFTVEKEDSAIFLRALENAQREVGIIEKLQENGLDNEKISRLSAIIHRFAVDDIHESLDNFFTPNLDENQFAKMISLVNDYLSQSVSERYGEFSGLNKILDFKNEIDRNSELNEFFAEHNFSDEQKSAVSEMFAVDDSIIRLNVIDESFLPEEIYGYYDILHNHLEADDIAVFLENRRKMAAEREKVPEFTLKEKAFLNGDILSFMTKSLLAWDEIEDLGCRLFEEGYNEKYAPHENTSFGNALSEKQLFELAKNMQNGEDIRRDLAVGLLGGQNVFITNHDNKFTAEYGENSITARYGNAERNISYEDLGDAFLSLIKSEYDDIVHDRTAEDLQYNIPDITAETADNLIKAFDSALTPDWQTNSNAVKNALNDILGDEEKTEKAFVSIADMKYNFKEPVKPDSLEFHFGDGKDKEWFTESTLLADFVEQNPNISFALANAVMEYLDEKQHSERNIEGLYAGWYKKTDFKISAVINGEDFQYEGRFDIGDGAGTGGGSLIDHIRTFNEGIIDYTQYPYNTPESKENARNMLNVFVPFLEQHSVLTPKEEKLLADFKEQHPIRGIDDVVQKMNVYHGTTADFETFRPDYRGAIWTDTNIDFARQYAGTLETSQVMTCEAELHNPAHFIYGSAENWDIDDTIRRARNGGHDSAIIEFKFMAEENSYYKFVLKNYPEHSARETLSNIVIASETDAYESETIAEFARRMAESDNVTHCYVAVFDPAQIRIVDKTPVSELQQDSESLESDNRFRIYQLPDGEKYHGIRYESMGTLEKDGVVLNHEDYKLMYEGSTSEFAGEHLLEEIFSKFNIDRPADFTGHSLSVSDVIVTEIDEEQKAYYCDRVGFVEMPDFFHDKFLSQEKSAPTVADLSVGDVILYEGKRREIEKISEHSISMKDLDAPDFGGVLLGMSDVLAYEGWQEEMNEKGFEILSKADRTPETIAEEHEAENAVVSDFRSKTAELFHSIDGYSAVDIENMARDFVESTFAESGIEAETGGIIVTGSRSRGIEHDNSDIDVVVEVNSELKEDALFNILHEKSLEIGGIPVDINPIREEETGTLETYLPTAETYLAEETNPREDAMDTAIRLINEYCEKEFDTQGNFSNLDYIDLAYTTDEETELPIQVYADLETFRIVTKYDDTVVNEELFDSLSDMCTALANLEFDELVALSDEEKAIVHAADKEDVTLTGNSDDAPEISAPVYDDTPLFTDADVIEEIEKSKNSADNRPFWETPDISGEQLSLFGDSVPLVPKRQSEPKKEKFAEGLFAGNVNRFTALHDEIMRGTGFQGGKFRVKQFYDEKKPANKEFADFLKHEYGIGGHSGDGEISFVDHDSKGMFFTLDSGEKFKFNWSDVAEMTAEIINKGEYITQKDMKMRDRYAQPKPIDVPEETEKTDTIEIGDKFRNKMTGEIIAETPDVKNLNQLKKALKAGMEFEITDHLRPECIGERRRITSVNTAGFTSRKLDEYGEPYGKDIHMEWQKSGSWKFENKTFTSTLDDNSLLMSFRLTGGAEHSKEAEHQPYSEEIMSSDRSAKYRISETSDEEHPYNVQILTKGENGEFAYCGNGKFCETLDEAKKFIQQDNSERTGLIDDEPVKSNNFTITDDSLGEGGAKSKFRANIEAIKTLKTLEKENRPATDSEKETLSKYVGWGGIPQAFDSENKAWNSEFSELKSLLTDKEYSSARASTLDAFFTSPTVIDGIYQALENFGFEGGNVLEPSCGVGNFFGKMPDEMRENSKLYGVEIDSISGRIAQKIYPDADIAIQGFEKNNFQNGCFDAAVGNVPFGELSFKDDIHGTAKLHDYFFAESLEKLKNGGILAFVTSAGTLDKRDESTRKMLAEKTDFIGAVRLPGGKNGAFKDNAGTEVTADIIFLQKNENKNSAEIPDWVHLGETADGLPINQYFAENPDMVLGKVVEGNKLYGTGTMVIADENSDLSEQLKIAVSKLSATISDEKARDVYAKSADGEQLKVPSNLRNYSFFEQDNKIYFKTANQVCHCRFDTKNSQFQRAKAFINLRDLTRELIEAQEMNKSDNVIKNLQSKLTSAYDNFYKKYGLIHSQSNKRYFSDDVSYNLVAGLEKKYDKTKLIEKSDIFTKRTIQPPKAIEHVETAIEALTLSAAEKAGVDFDYMSSLTGMTEDELKHGLQGEIFKIPHTENEYQTASEYLSGDIREKLNIAEEIAEYDADFAVNVNALKSAVPEPLKAGDIDVKIGATWLDPKYYEQFMYELFQTPRENRTDVTHYSWQRSKTISAEYSEHSGTWHIDNKSADRSVITSQQFGTKKMNAYEIMEHLLNLKEPKVYKTIEIPDGMGDVKEKRVVDIDATKVVQRKADKIKDEFKKWIFRDSARREEIVGKYNELFNSVKPREYNGSALQFPMMNTEITLHEHQKNAVAHALFGGNTLFAHSVGAGKTFEMIAAAMESKRLGLCTKSLFAVPNHLTEQIGDDFQKLYPSANILVATKKDFQKENRQQLFAKIATGNFDAIIIGHSQLGMIPISKERREAEIKSQIDDIVLGIAELKASEGSKFQVKAMERTKKSLEKQLAKLEKNHDDTISFEQLGVDKLFVDEAHEFKNLFTPTKLTNISGISSSASQKALDLYLKCRYLDEKTGGKGIVFATGTPLSNSVTELHTMMRYLEYDFLKSKNLQHFDNWISVFGEQKSDWELAPAGNNVKVKNGQLMIIRKCL